MKGDKVLDKKIKITGDYHTHTLFSHGKGSIEANVRAAIEIGLKSIGVSDHGLAHLIRGLSKDEIRASRLEVDRLNALLGDKIKVLLGVEANIISLSGTIDLKEDMWDYFDFVLVGYHPIAMFEHVSDLFKMYLRNAMPRRRTTVIGRNTEALVRAMELYKIDVFTHPGFMMPVDMKLVAQAAVRTGTLLEINSKHGILSAEQIRIAAKEGARFIIDSDAHVPFNVGNFSNALDIFIESGVPISTVVNSTEGERFVMRNGLVLGGGE